MLIHNGDATGFARAADMVSNNPHPAHLLEYYALAGEDKSMRELIDMSVDTSEVGVYSIHEEAALVCGVANGDRRRLVWMLTTRNARNYPKWLLRALRRTLLDAEEFFSGRVDSFYQLIPLGYCEGLNYVRHLGFSLGDILYCKASGYEIQIVEKGAGKWESERTGRQ